MLLRHPSHPFLSRSSTLPSFAPSSTKAIPCGRADAFQVFGSEHVCKEYDEELSAQMWKDELVRVFELLTAIEDPDADVASKKLAAALKMSG